MHCRLRYCLFVVSSALVLGVPPGGQVGAGQDAQVPTFRTGVEAVQLSVIVTDTAGNPVSGLAADDFEIIENTVVRPVTTFRAVNIPLERVERSPAETDVVSNDGPPDRVYLIVLDQMAPENALRMRHVLREFIERFFGPNDMAAVALTTRGRRDWGQGFTSNPRLLLNAIDKFNGGDVLDAWERENNLSQDLRDLMRRGRHSFCD